MRRPRLAVNEFNEFASPNYENCLICRFSTIHIKFLTLFTNNFEVSLVTLVYLILDIFLSEYDSVSSLINM